MFVRGCDSENVSVAISLNRKALALLVLKFGNGALTWFAITTTSLDSELSPVFQCNCPVAMPPISGNT